MKPTPLSFGLFLLILFNLSNATASTLRNDSTIASLNFIGEYVIPHHQNFKETTIGGLSGIDYDSKNDIYFLISDDRSAINPVRFYTAKIKLSSKGIDTVQFLQVQWLLAPDGKSFPSSKQNPAHTPDPEAIRFNVKTQQLIWTSEGERIIKPGQNILTNSEIIISGLDGKFIGIFPPTQNQLMQPINKGPRQNGALEGITFANDYRTLYACLEEPLYEDGPRADIIKTNSWVRLYQYDVETRNNIAQYAYHLEPVARPTLLPNTFKVNGVSEILSVNDHQLLIVERSFSTGRLACTIKIFITDLGHAENIIANPSLLENPPSHYLTKRLILNTDDLGIYIDNVEGVTFGPTLPNGHRTLIFVTDNNFVPLEKTQLLLFEVIPN